MPRPKPIPVPKRKQRAAAGKSAEARKSAAAKEAGLDLSYIAPELRGHAVPIGEVAFFRDNPRQHSEADLELTKASLARFGQVELLVVNRRENPPVVLNGNGRLQGALALGWSHVAVHFVDLDSAEAGELAVTLNRTGEKAGWDKAALDRLLPNMDLGTDPVLCRMMAELAQEMKKAEAAPADATPGGAAGAAASAAGGAGDESDKLAEKYQILIDCRDEIEQAALLERLTADGVTCRALIV